VLDRYWLPATISAAAVDAAERLHADARIFVASMSASALIAHADLLNRSSGGSGVYIDEQSRPTNRKRL